MDNKGKKFEYLEVGGSYEDVGYAIGKKFKSSIQGQIERRKNRIRNYDNFLKRSKPYFEYTRDFFPNLIKELQATAEAAEVGVMDYFSINNREVYDPEQDKDIKKKVKGSEHCTVAVSFNNDGAIVGHNEDWQSASSDALYILKATIKGTTFIGLQYKVATSGVAVSVNNWGLVQCINDLYQTTQIGVPKNFLARAVLECKSLDEAEGLLRNTKRASGFNHVLVQGGEVRNVEIAGDTLAVEKVFGIPYVHTNHYLSVEMKLLEKFHTKSSEARYERAKEIIKPNMTKDEMRILLSDTKNKEFPICREDATLGSLIAIPEKNEVYICYNRPDFGKFIKYSI